MTCEGCKYYKDKKGTVPQCVRFWTHRPERCIDYRLKQGQRKTT